MLAVVVAQIRFHPILKVSDPGRLAQFQDLVRPRFPGYEIVDGESLEVGPQGIRVVKAPAHRFLAADGEAAVLSINTASLSVEYSQHRERDVCLADAKMALDALERVYAPIVPTRLGLRYVNAIDRERVSLELGRSIAWNELLASSFAEPPGAIASLDDSTNFVAEITSACARGAMTLRYGAITDQGTKAQQFRIDTDRFIDGQVALGEIQGLLKAFSDDIFQLFMTAAGPALLEWMGKRHA